MERLRRTKQTKIHHGPFAAGIQTLTDQELETTIQRWDAKPEWDTEAKEFLAALREELELRKSDQ